MGLIGAVAMKRIRLITMDFTHKSGKNRHISAPYPILSAGISNPLKIGAYRVRLPISANRGYLKSLSHGKAAYRFERVVSKNRYCQNASVVVVFPAHTRS